jgi:hypothetical protein
VIETVKLKLLMIALQDLEILPNLVEAVIEETKNHYLEGDLCLLLVSQLSLHSFASTIDSI